MTLCLEKTYLCSDATTPELGYCFIVQKVTGCIAMFLLCYPSSFLRNVSKRKKKHISSDQGRVR